MPKMATYRIYDIVNYENGNIFNKKVTKKRRTLLILNSYNKKYIV